VSWNRRFRMSTQGMHERQVKGVLRVYSDLRRHCGFRA